jgi:hypothetical protein
MAAAAADTVPLPGLALRRSGTYWQMDLDLRCYKVPHLW